MAVSSRTDADGRFVLDEVNPAPSLQLSVSHPDHKAYRSETLAVAPGEHVSGVDIRLVTGGRLVVTVSTPAGERLSGAGVRIRLSEQSRERGADGSRYRIPESRYRMFGERRSSSSDWRMTDASGVAAFSGVTAGVYSISVDVKGYQPFRDSVTVAADQAVDVPVALLPGNTIGGVVVDSTGNPVAGASVRAREEVEDEGDGGESSRRRRHESWTRSREDGSFVVGSLGPGPYELRVYRRGYAEGRLHSVPVNSDQNVVLERLGSIAGWVLGAETGLPVPAFEIRLLEGGSEAASEDGEGRGFGGDRGDRSRGRGERVRDPQGVFLVDNLAPGRYTVSFSARGYTGARIRVTVADGEAVENLEVRLLEGLAVSGIAIDGKSGLPVAEAQVFLIARSASVEEGRDERRIDGRRSRRERPSRERGRSGRRREADEGQLEALAMLSTLKGRGDALATDEEGYFRLPEVRPGRYTLIVSHDDYVPSSETVTVREDRSSPEVLVRLDRGQELRGTVTFARWLPAAGVTLLFENGQGITKQVVTDRAGNYTTTGFLPGRYSMRVMATRGSETRGVSVTIEKGKNKFDYDIPEESSPRTPGNSR
ncbi:MAG: carboxypeptidase regulatory-like domain-containing protein, partial [Planctomycetota bacterium]|nr:carboxypeptidase regulatory-like domain-containing protein [Planctomycetota bacterium]